MPYLLRGMQNLCDEIFLNLPPQHVVCVCRLVCRQWKDVADSESFWRERCRREGYRLRDPSRVPSNNWRLFYFLCKKRRNLIKNPRAEDEFQSWEILKNGGHKWTIEGSKVQHSNPAVQKNYVTSFDWCTKVQVIDLTKEGYSPSFMDKFQPPIRISDCREFTKASDSIKGFGILNHCCSHCTVSKHTDSQVFKQLYFSHSVVKTHMLNITKQCKFRFCKTDHLKAFFLNVMLPCKVL
uniref:F-box only protein 6-like n=1 Tax=Poecilia reticulata TaxID=8081 RepID=A0A3P9N8N2_POERE